MAEIHPPPPPFAPQTPHRYRLPESSDQFSQSCEPFGCGGYTDGDGNTVQFLIDSRGGSRALMDDLEAFCRFAHAAAVADSAPLPIYVVQDDDLQWYEIVMENGLFEQLKPWAKDAPIIDQDARDQLIYDYFHPEVILN